MADETTLAKVMAEYGYTPPYAPGPAEWTKVIERAIVVERERCARIVRSWLSEHDWEVFEEIAKEIENP